MFKSFVKCDGQEEQIISTYRKKLIKEISAKQKWSFKTRDQIQDMFKNADWVSGWCDERDKNNQYRAHPMRPEDARYRLYYVFEEMSVSGYERQMEEFEITMDMLMTAQTAESVASTMFSTKNMVDGVIQDVPLLGLEGGVPAASSEKGKSLAKKASKATPAAAKARGVTDGFPGDGVQRHAVEFRPRKLDF